MLRALGILLLSLPFIGIAAIALATIGVIQTLLVFGIAGGTMALIFAGFYLIDQH